MSRFGNVGVCGPTAAESADYRSFCMTKKRKVCLLFAAAILIVVAIFHASILRLLARGLIVDQHTNKTDYICLVGWSYGDHCYDVAAGLNFEDPDRRILLLGPGPSRIEQIGAKPSFEEIGRRELTTRGVSPSSISFIQGGRYSDWDDARSLAAWFREHRQESVLVLCDQFHSALFRDVLDAVLPAADADRVFVQSLPSRQCDDTNWWKRRSGYRNFAANWLLRFQFWVGGGDIPPSRDRNAGEYQRDFLKTLPPRKP
jgi:hypothetical protein